MDIYLEQQQTKYDLPSRDMEEFDGNGSCKNWNYESARRKHRRTQFDSALDSLDGHKKHKRSEKKMDILCSINVKNILLFKLIIRKGKG